MNPFHGYEVGSTSESANSSNFDSGLDISSKRTEDNILKMSVGGYLLAVALCV
jgi:hypothetical protein